MYNPSFSFKSCGDSWSSVLTVTLKHRCTCENGIKTEIMWTCSSCGLSFGYFGHSLWFCQVPLECHCDIKAHETDGTTNVQRLKNPEHGPLIWRPSWSWKMLSPSRSFAKTTPHFCQPASMLLDGFCTLFFGTILRFIVCFTNIDPVKILFNI